MGAENVHDGLAQLFRILHQMEEFVGTAQADRVRSVPQVFDGIFQTFLPLPSLGVLVGFGLRVRCVLHGLSPLIGYDSLQCQQNTAHADSEKGQDFVFLVFL